MLFQSCVYTKQAADKKNELCSRKENWISIEKYKDKKYKNI